MCATAKRLGARSNRRGATEAAAGGGPGDRKDRARASVGVPGVARLVASLFSSRSPAKRMVKAGGAVRLCKIEVGRGAWAGGGEARMPPPHR